MHHMSSNTYFFQIRVVRAKFENMTFYDDNFSKIIQSIHHPVCEKLSPYFSSSSLLMDFFFEWSLGLSCFNLKNISGIS